MAGQEIALVELPFEVVKNSGGFAMDMGGSVAKIVYRDKRDWDFDKNEPKKVNGNFAHVRAFMMAREKRKEVLNYIKEHCHVTHVTGGETVIYTTGIGSHEYGEEFGSAFNVGLKNLTEMDCFIKAFHYLVKNMPESKFLHEVPARTYERFRVLVEQYDKMADTSKEGHMSESNFEWTKQTKDEQMQAIDALQTLGLSEKDGDTYGKQSQVYPCLLGMLGSGIGYMRIDIDRTFAAIDMSNRGGRLFLGLGSILTGSKSYEELMELAEKGDAMNVHTCVKDYHMQDTGEDDLYSNLPQDLLVFCYGKGSSKTIGDFKKKDLARALLHHICTDLAQTTYLTLKSQDVKTVFMCGGFGNSPLVRALITDEFLQRTLIRGEVGKRDVRFVKNGSFLGAVGAFLEGYKI